MGYTHDCYFFFLNHTVVQDKWQYTVHQNSGQTQLCFITAGMTQKQVNHEIPVASTERKTPYYPRSPNYSKHTHAHTHTSNNQTKLQTPLKPNEVMSLQIIHTNLATKVKQQISKPNTNAVMFLPSSLTTM